MNAKKLYVRPCSEFNGVNPRTGKRVGSKHRWKNGGGKCIFCGRTKKQVRSRSKIDDESPRLIAMGFVIE